MERLLWMEHQLNQLVWGWGSILFLLVSACWFLFRAHRLLLHPQRWLRSLFRALHGEQGKEARSSLYTALAGTLGIGSIVGAASALALGGAGALFWLMVSGLAGMVLKYVETTLACAYQRPRAGGFIGGAMILLGEVRGRVFLSVCFSLCVLVAAFGIGSMAPSSAITGSLCTLFPISRWWAAMLVVALAALVLIGKGERIRRVNERIVPLVSMLYIAVCLLLLFVYQNRLPAVFGQVLQDAFAFPAIGGGVSGFCLSRAVHYGLARGLFSHEAGMGSAPLAYAALPCREPVEQGCVGMLEVFFDTFVITLLSALALLCTTPLSTASGVDGSVLMSGCFSLLFGPLGERLFHGMLILFAFPTILGWYYYAEQCLHYLFSDQGIHRIYLFLFLCSLFLGGIWETKIIWELCDTLNGCMLLVNLTAMWSFQRECAQLTDRYVCQRGCVFARRTDRHLHMVKGAVDLQKKEERR